MDFVIDPNTGLLAPDWFSQEPKHARFILNRVTDVDVAARACAKTSVAVQAGGYVGLWPLRLIKHFSVVHTFEPVLENFECLRRNVQHAAGVVAYQNPLSDVDGKEVKFVMRKGWGSGIHGLAKQPDEPERYETFKSRSIDALNLPVCDLIYLDIEGSELLALDGAKETIARCKPVIALEVWEENRDRYHRYMGQLGYSPLVRTHADTIFIKK